MGNCNSKSTKNDGRNKKDISKTTLDILRKGPSSLEHKKFINEKKIFPKDDRIK